MTNEPIADPADPHADRIARLRAEYAALPGLGSIRADRTIPIRNRRHSVSHKAIR